MICKQLPQGETTMARNSLFALAITFLALSAQAQATTFYACVEKNGQITMASATDTCKPNETKIQWTSTGSTGPQGPQGPAGPQGPQGPAGAPGHSSPNPLKVALLRWYDVLQAPAINLGTSTAFLVWDGANVWVSTGTGVAKIRANDGNVLAQYTLNSNVAGVAYDGTYIWAANNSQGSISRLRASDGACVPVAGPGTSGPAGACSVMLGSGNDAAGVAFDGTHVWATNRPTNSVFKIRASDGTLVSSYPVGASPFGVAFDGANIWVTNTASNNVTKLRASDGSLLGIYPTGAYPIGIAFDGDNMWITNLVDSTVTRLRASDGACAAPCTFPVPTTPYSIVFDGTSLWVTGYDAATITKLRASDGANMGSFAAAPTPIGVAFDGANLWVAHHTGNTVTKH
jgi:hypothetical protein